MRVYVQKEENKNLQYSGETINSLLSYVIVKSKPFSKNASLCAYRSVSTIAVCYEHLEPIHLIIA
jgi:hypothetical protein